MGDGTKENPYTREDVLRLIKENGGTAEGLDLSEKVFEAGIDLEGLDLQGIILTKADLRHANLERANLQNAHLQEAYLRDASLEGANLGKARLERADLWDAHLEGASLLVTHLEEAYLQDAHLEDASLFGAHFEEAYLQDAHLENANLLHVHLEKADLRDAHLEESDLWEAHLKGAYLHGAKLSTGTRLENVDWGNYVLGEERDGLFEEAADAYRRLKMWYTEHGTYDIAREFFFREMTAKRKELKWWPNALPKIQQTLYWLLCGYGERPWQVVVSGGVVVIGLALVYYAIGTLTPNTFLNSLYYSAVSFTALGYGSWAPQPTGWAKAMGAAEAFIGVFMIALFLVTFTRKMTR